MLAQQFDHERRTAPAAQQRPEQLWIWLSLLSVAVSIEPIGWLLGTSSLSYLWPLSWVRRLVRTCALFLSLLFMTMMLGSIANRQPATTEGSKEGGVKKRGRARWIKIVALVIFFVLLVMDTEPMIGYIKMIDKGIMQSIDPSARRKRWSILSIEGNLIIGYLSAGTVWLLCVLRLFLLAICRVPWKDPAAKTERLFLLFLVSALIVFVLSVFFSAADAFDLMPAKKNRKVSASKMTNIFSQLFGIISLEYLLMLAHIFWPSNLDESGAAAFDLVSDLDV